MANNNTFELFKMGNADPEREKFEHEVKERNKELRQHKKAGIPIVCMSFTSFGIVAPGMPIPEGVPSNFALKQAALVEFQSGSSTGLRNFRGEAAYRKYYNDIMDNQVQWLAFFDELDDYEHAEHTCGILGTLATIYRQRGALDDCERVLDLELEVLSRYERSTDGAPTALVSCFDAQG